MRHRISIPVIILLITSLACGQSANVPTLDPNAASTAIVETIAAIQIQGTASALPASDATVTLIPTVTPFPTQTLAFTPTSATPTISVSVDTFCRTGPGKDFEKVGILLVGEETEIVGRHATGQYWYVRNPDTGADFCWMSGEYATITGNTLLLLIQTPPASVTTDFEITYLGMGRCSGAWWSDLRLKSRSDQIFESMSLTIRDLDTNTYRTTTNNDFTFVDGCGGPQPPVDFLIQGGSLKLSSPSFSYSMNGNNMSVAITLCTASDLRGACVSRSISYIP
jgi:hypothetical protein